MKGPELALPPASSLTAEAWGCRCPHPSVTCARVNVQESVAAAWPSPRGLGRAVLLVWHPITSQLVYFAALSSRVKQ